jgi:hypothetical protein
VSELDQYAAMSPEERRAYNAQKAGQAAKKRALAHLDMPDEPISNMPPGYTLSPAGDLGAAGQVETLRVFKNPIKIPKKLIIRAADALPLKEKFAQ